MQGCQLIILNAVIFYYIIIEHQVKIKIQKINTWVYDINIKKVLCTDNIQFVREIDSKIF